MSSAPDSGRVDFHHHFLPSGEQATAMIRRLMVDTEWSSPDVSFPRWTPEISLSAMDSLGIRTAILSLPNDLEHALAPEQRRGFAREVNTGAARIVAEHPGRFGFFAHLPTPTDIDGALEELRYALDTLGADGVTLTNVYGNGAEARSLGDPVFEPLWAELDRRGALVFLHGEQTFGSNGAPSRFLPVPVSEVPNETYKAAADLVTSGRKRQFPNVRIILSHSGGSTPFLASRVAGLSPLLGCELTPEEIIADFRTFYFETALSGFETNLLALENFVPAGQILFGTDFPAIPRDTAAWYTGNVDRYCADRPELFGRLMHGNAERLLPRLSPR
ncbi:amidohydrolase family protein [Sciscionella sediminilitoris]|uniref:amidohydrolase family protein n=1 Tax=Sciscionella sediminilitoris TaxID=1445613 RepID=UPI0004DED0F3|nr:amidohydrolase family protein [Sciscionella sp. SE31]